MPEPVSIQVGGNVDGSIVVGDHNFVVNTNHGTIVYKQSAPQVRPRQYVPQPPRPPREFLDRSEELAKLEAWISEHEIVLIHAPDGMGKSALLKQAANTSAARAMPNGVVLLESVDVDGQALGPDDLVQNLFDALFESDPPLKVDAVSARTYLSNTRPLVLMDEVGLSPAFQKTLPDLFPQGAILLTADMPFGSDFERLPVGPLPRREAVNLLATKADLTLNEANRPVLDSVCDLLNDVSLAIVITGNVMRETKTAPGIALQTIQKLSPTTPDPVSLALDRAFAFAFGTLKPEEQKILSVAALTPGVSMSSDWLAAALPGVAIETFVERLKALGLLFANSPRLRLPPGFRGPARRSAVIDEAGLMPGLVQFLIAPLQGNPQNWDYIRDELGNFLGALTWAIRSRRFGDVITLVRALDPYLSLHGLWDAWGTALGYLLDAARQAGEQSMLAWALHQSGVRELGVGTRQRALEFLKQALELRRVLGDEAGMAYTQHNIDLLMGAPPPGSHGTKPAANGTQTPRPGWFWPGLVVLVVVAGLAIWLGTTIFHPFGATPVSVTPPTRVTPTLDLTVTPTATPTPPGGSKEIVFQVQATALLQADALLPVSALLYTVHTNGSNPQKLLDIPARDPAWAPDGRRLAFVSNSQSDYSQIYISNADGSDPQVLAIHANLNASHPAWSPDGKLIAFTGNDPELGADIYVVGADGGDPTNLTGGIKENVDDPKWSPDGTRIAFQAALDGGWQIFIMNADGSGSVQLTSAALDLKGQSSLQPAWSPDGKRLAFVSNRSGNWNISVIDADGMNIQPLTAGKFTDLFPDWSPDGNLIAFSSNREGSLQLYLMAADGSGVALLASTPGTSVEADWQPGQP